LQTISIKYSFFAVKIIIFELNSLYKFN